ncbi:MAG TPA: outer membrane beta-barrel protein [Vicinamibacterales bacterium]|nr:outer membrane beta-barrel protein [Vicinamibacterales bacterium]
MTFPSSHLRPSLGSLCCLLALTTTAAAQEHPADQVRSTARVHAGPFYITPALLLRDLGVDSNVFNDPVDPKSDFTFTVVPRADIAVPIARRAMLKALGSLDLVYFQKYSSERSVDPHVTPRVEFYIHKITLFGEGTYVRTRARPSFEIDARSLRTEQALRGGIGYRYSPRFELEVSGGRADVDFDEDEVYQNVSLRRTLNRRSKVAAGSVRYALTTFTTFVVKADSSQDRFEFAPERDADTVRVMPGFELKSRALISGSGYVGVRRFNTKSDALEDFNGVVASAMLGYSLLGRTTFIFTAERDVTYSFELRQPYFVVDSYGLTIRHRLVGRLDVMAGAGRHQYTYRDFSVDVVSGVNGTATAAAVPGAGALPAPERVDVTRSLSGSIGYMLGPDVRLSFGTSYWKRESNSTSYRDYDGFRTGVSLNYGF